ncbi:hypothetical protein ACIP98_38345 [Streptomyces sp. NPDC088354]|uniref:hypothetical protein n=1 Tax=Streptomyces sp. NPDC088354 TaxID=3365856 RepID=UPI00380E854F
MSGSSTATGGTDGPQQFRPAGQRLRCRRTLADPHGRDTGQQHDVMDIAVGGQTRPIQTDALWTVKSAHSAQGDQSAPVTRDDTL